MTEKLKKCPFCGGEAAAVNFKPGRPDGYWQANCKRCGCKTKYITTEKEAIKDWNRRAEDENPALTLEELFKMDGQPIYIKSGMDEKNHIYKREGWQIAAGLSKYSEHFFVTYENEQFPISNYGKKWLAYRRKPEDGK